MTFRLDKATNRKLEGMKSSYRIIHNGGEGTCTAEMVCTITGKTYAKATGANEEDAVRNGIKAAEGASRPRTPSQAMVDAERLDKENAALKAENAALRAGRAFSADEDLDARQEAFSRTKAASTTTPPEQDAGPVGDEGLESLTAAELVSMIKANGKTVPEGNRKTQEWRDAAIALCDDSDAE